MRGNDGEVDWNEAWRVLREGRTEHTAEYWDGRSARYVVSAKSEYVQAFLRLAGVRPGESVLDMGCGSGTLALPLAAAGHEVCAMDFSRGMLDKLEQRAAEAGTTGIRTVQGSWDDDWHALGVEQYDVVFASRSAATDNLRSAFAKMDAAARRRVCMTLAASESPRHDQRVMNAIGRDLPPMPICAYGYNVLMQMGIFADISYIVSWKDVGYPTYEELRADMEEPLGSLTSVERERLERFCEQHLHQVAEPDGQLLWKRDYSQPIRWAFLSWDKQD